MQRLGLTVPLRPVGFPQPQFLATCALLLLQLAWLFAVGSSSAVCWLQALVGF